MGLPKIYEDFIHSIELPIPTEASNWIQRRPPQVREFMLKFPPSCVVKNGDKFGIITSYIEGSPIKVTVREFPDSPFRFDADPSQLEVVAYCDGLTPSDIAKILLYADAN